MARWNWFAGRKRLDLDDEDFQQEVAAHLQIAIHDKIAGGMDPVEARYAALREFGNVTKTTETARRVWTPGWLEFTRDLASDARYAIRTLVKNRTFALTVIAVLGVGIGLNATVFTMLKGMVISPVAGVERSADLKVIFGETQSGRQTRLSYPEYQYLRDHVTAFAGLMGTAVTRANLGRGRGAQQVWAEIVSGNYFQVLGVHAPLGRTLLPSDEIAPGRHPVVVIGDRLWRREYAADPAIVGRTIDVNNHPLTVVGVAAPSFHGTSVVYEVDLYIPVMMAPQLGYTFGSQQSTPAGIFADRAATFFFPQGFLRPGARLADAEAQTAAAVDILGRERQTAAALHRLRVVKFWQTPSGAPSFLLPTLVVLTTMGVLVLLIACANIAGLVVVRGLSRRGEIAMRLALGASRARVIRLLVIEPLVLAVPGTLLGILLATAGIPRLVGYAEWLASPDRLFFNVEVDGLVIGFAAAIAAVSALMVGLFPALQSARLDLVTVINEDASPRGAARTRLRAGLVVAQVAVSLTLIVAAGLVWRSVVAARNTNPGFDSQQVAALLVDLRHNNYDEHRGRIFYRRLLETGRAATGTESISLAAHHPLSLQDTRALDVKIEGHQSARHEDLAFPSNVVSPGYFRTLRVNLLAGRDFEDRDTASSQPVAIVNATFATRYWGQADKALGKRVQVAGQGWRTVVGVVSDLKYARIDEGPRPYFYLPLEQSYRPGMLLYVRSSTPIEALLSEARAWVTTIDEELPILYARPLAERLRGAFIFYDLAATMLLIFGLCGVALAALGTYGLVSFTVVQSTHEIGLRMALGATSSSIVGTFIAKGLRLGAVGTVIGLIAAVAAARLVASVLYGVSALDPLAFGVALIVVLGGVTAATFVPAWRASRTDPLSALRHQ
jgi:predicted permease